MAEAQLNTSGEVLAQLPGEAAYPITWSDLDEIKRGYIEAMLADYAADVHGEADPGFSFRDLSPEALAQVRDDCNRQQLFVADTKAGGRAFWRKRQRLQFDHQGGFPPLTLYLAEDGKLHLTERGRT